MDELGAHRVACVVTTTSCFAPRACDDVVAVAKLCKAAGVAHVVNNAPSHLFHAEEQDPSADPWFPDSVLRPRADQQRVWGPELGAVCTDHVCLAQRLGGIEGLLALVSLRYQPPWWI